MADRMLSGFAVDLPLSLALGFAAAVYVWAARRAERWPARRTAAFMAGLAVLAVALQSGLHSHGERLLSVHMVQHMALTLVVPPLLLLGAPVSLAMRTLPRRGRRVLLRSLHGRLVRTLTTPGVAWAVFVAVLVGTHAPAFYDAALRQESLHELEHALYLAASVVFWLPLLSAEPLPSPPSPLARILVLLAVMPPMALVGVWLMLAGDVVYPAYAETGASPLDDQRSAGRIMWIGGTFALVALTLVLGWREIRREEERARLRESYADRGGGP